MSAKPEIRWRLGTPPGWLRHFISWRLLKWIDRRFLVCWSSLVDWKMSGEAEWPGICRDCFYPYDYCGKYDKCDRETRERAWQVYQESAEHERIYSIR